VTEGLLQARPFTNWLSGRQIAPADPVGWRNYCCTRT
jgi:hypothetical protein